MNMQYDIKLKKKLCEDICLNGKSTIKTAEEYNVPIKTLEKWITAFNKDNHCFDYKISSSNDFKLINVSSFDPITDLDDLSNDDLKLLIMKKDIEIARLKKGYLVKEGGTGRKEFITFSKKNTK